VQWSSSLPTSTTRAWSPTRPSALSRAPSAYLWTGVQRFLIVNSVGGSQAALSCTADVATGVHGLPGRVFQGRDPALAMPPFIVGDRLG
jgi:hypothetical protein